MMNYLQSMYDLTETVVISNSDGGSGYEKEVFDELSLGCLRHEHFRDSYHVHRKIKERLNFVPQKLQQKMIQAVHNYDLESVHVCMDTVESLIDEKEEMYLEQLRLLSVYLQRNWKYLKPAECRDLKDSFFCIGTIESTHRKMTYRMKRQGRLWTKNGAKAMIYLIDSLRNNDLEQWLNQYRELPEDVFEREERWKKMKRIVQKSPKFQTHEGVFRGEISTSYATSLPIGQFAKELGQLNTTPHYL